MYEKVGADGFLLRYSFDDIIHNLIVNGQNNGIRANHELHSFVMNVNSIWLPLIGKLLTIIIVLMGLCKLQLFYTFTLLINIQPPYYLFGLQKLNPK